jgi:hypothetical protein
MLDFFPYGYADGSGNRYEIGPEIIVYHPVTPAESSTGIYSGGEPFSAAIGPAQYREIVYLLEAARQPGAGHAPARAKGTGAIWKRLNATDGGSPVWLSMNSPAKAAIEQWLHNLTVK